MKRRDFLSTFAASAAALWPAVGHAQEKPVPVIGVLDGGDPGPFLTEFGRGLRDLGYVEGRNIQIEVRSAAGKSELLRSLAEELARRKVDVIVARLTPPVRAAKDATQTIPIVMAPAGAPLETGRNFAAGMSGGIAYVWDPKGQFDRLCNKKEVALEPVLADEGDDNDEDRPRQRAPNVVDNGMGDPLRFDAQRLRILIERHHLFTGSARARALLEDWDNTLRAFVKIVGGLPARSPRIESGARRCPDGRRRVSQSS